MNHTNYGTGNYPIHRAAVSLLSQRRKINRKKFYTENSSTCKHFHKVLTSIPRPQPLTWMKPSQHNSQLSQFNYLMDTGHSWWNVLIRWFSLLMIVRKMIASHTNWNISAFLLFARNLALTRIMDWRRRWDICCTLLSWLSIVVGRGYLHYVHYPHLHMRNVTGNAC